MTYYNGENITAKTDMLRDHSNPLELPSTKTISYFRLNKEAFCFLLNEMKEHFHKHVRATEVFCISKLCATLRVFADRNYNKSCENYFNVELAKSINDVLNTMEKCIRAK